jgi:Ca2+-transporting ATPase
MAIFNHLLANANKWLNMAILWELALLALIVYAPFMHTAFNTFSLPLNDLIIVAVLAFTVIPVLETAKWMERKGWFGELA